VTFAALGLENPLEITLRRAQDDFSLNVKSGNCFLTAPECDHLGGLFGQVIRIPYLQADRVQLGLAQAVHDGLGSAQGGIVNPWLLAPSFLCLVKKL
jgi:hypothetical protein